MLTIKQYFQTSPVARTFLVGLVLGFFTYCGMLAAQYYQEGLTAATLGSNRSSTADWRKLSGKNVLTYNKDGGKIAIGTDNPDPNADFEVVGTIKGTKINTQEIIGTNGSILLGPVSIGSNGLDVKGEIKVSKNDRTSISIESAANRDANIVLGRDGASNLWSIGNYGGYQDTSKREVAGDDRLRILNKNGGSEVLYLSQAGDLSVPNNIREGCYQSIFRGDKPVNQQFVTDWGDGWWSLSCDEGYFMAGISCNGGYCDNVGVICCKI